MISSLLVARKRKKIQQFAIAEVVAKDDKSYEIPYSEIIRAEAERKRNRTKLTFFWRNGKRKFNVSEDLLSYDELVDHLRRALGQKLEETAD